MPLLRRAHPLYGPYFNTSYDSLFKKRKLTPGRWKGGERGSVCEENKREIGKDKEGGERGNQKGDTPTF